MLKDRNIPYNYREYTQDPLSEEELRDVLGKLGLPASAVFRKRRCTSCHRALRNGTNMGLSLDGVGSRRSREWLYNFLRDPEATYGAPTVDHGYPPKEASYVASLPDEELQYLATFLPELKADQGSAAAPEPPSGRSEFIDSMVGAFAPKSWKEKYKDVRERDGEQQQQGDRNEQ